MFERAADRFDELVVVVMVNANKKTMFTIDERVEMLSEATAFIGNVRVMSWQGLLGDFVREQGITAIVKGLRGGDADYELPMAKLHRTLAGADTCFISGDPAYGFLSSSLVKELAARGGGVIDLVPAAAHGRLLRRLAGLGNI
ncbi:pantetheine-phosphate adenylyltransferase [Nocardia sp. IFM 10818]